MKTLRPSMRYPHTHTLPDRGVKRKKYNANITFNPRNSISQPVGKPGAGNLCGEHLAP